MNLQAGDAERNQTMLLLYGGEALHELHDTWQVQDRGDQDNVCGMWKVRLKQHFDPKKHVDHNVFLFQK